LRCQTQYFECNSPKRFGKHLTAWNQKASFGDGLIAGLAGGVLGGAAGIAGGLAGAGTTAALGNGFWATVASGAAGGMTGGFVGGYLGGRAATTTIEIQKTLAHMYSGGQIRGVRAATSERIRKKRRLKNLKTLRREFCDN